MFPHTETVSVALFPFLPPASRTLLKAVMLLVKVKFFDPPLVCAQSTDIRTASPVLCW